VIFYADRETDSIRRTMEETGRRRERQERYNGEHGIEPRTILKDIHSPLVKMSELDYFPAGGGLLADVAEGSELPIREQIARLEKRMKDAAKRLEFEEAALYRDRIKELREIQIYAE
jgi:excinuclease ABC subunit B